MKQKQNQGLVFSAGFLVVFDIFRAFSVVLHTLKKKDAMKK